MDLETIYCKLLYNRDRSFISLIDADPSHFLCTYETHCFSICHCCEYNACDCKMTCPTNCTCFHDQSWNSNVVECTAVGYTDMPTNIPMDTTELYIDGNSLNELSGHSFIGRKNLRVLYANNSNIQVVYNTTFLGVRKLTVLHLENNRIGRFLGSEFAPLESLRELYLQNNRITFIDNRTFGELRKLEVLRLDNNKMMHFEVWQLALNPYLVEIGLADNMWSCECTFLGRLREFQSTLGEKIVDSARIACVHNNLPSMVNDQQTGALCAPHSGAGGDISTVAHTGMGGGIGGLAGIHRGGADDIENMLPFLLAATCAFVGFFGMLLGAFCYRHELSDWWHGRGGGGGGGCAAALCYKSAAFHHPDDYDKDRLYDAYISYSLQDEHFVTQILANTLENNVGYKLCLHYRDFNVNTYVADSIVEAVDSSRRTLLVLSRNFLYNEWSRFEVKSALHECIKRRRKLVFILYGDLPQRDIDADMRMYLRASTCIEWDDKKFWQKLRMAMPNLRGMSRGSGADSGTGHGGGGAGHGGGNGTMMRPGGVGASVSSNCLSSKRSAVNIYATTTTTNTGGHYHLSNGGGTIGRSVHPMAGLPPMPGHVVDYHTGRRCMVPMGGLMGAGMAGIDGNNYATINDCGRNCDKYESVLCKYSSTNERQRGGAGDAKHQQHQHPLPGHVVPPPPLPPGLMRPAAQLAPQNLERQFNHHEYAVPSNLMLDDCADDDDLDDEVDLDERRYVLRNVQSNAGSIAAGQQTAAGVMAASSSNSSQHSGVSSAVSSGASLPSASSANVFSFNSSQNCNNCDNAQCAGDETCSLAPTVAMVAASAPMDASPAQPSGPGRGTATCMTTSRQQQQQQQQALWA